MGYGEVGGGGSVSWTVVHGGNGTVKNDKDPKPDKGGDGRFGGGKFIVIANGVRMEFDIKDQDDQIQIYWPPHYPERLDEATKVKVAEARKKNKAEVVESV